MKRRNIRKRRAIDEEEEDSPSQQGDGVEKPVLTADDIKLLQKQRKRKTGVDANALAGTTTSTKTTDFTQQSDTINTTILQAAFNKERRHHVDEEDIEMKDYIEEQLARRLGKPLPQHSTHQQSTEIKTIEEAALEATAPKQKHVYNDMENAFVSGVEEVPLAMEHRLKNIEATEAAKSALLSKETDEKHGVVFDSVIHNTSSAFEQSRSLHRSLYPAHFGKHKDNEAEQRQEAALKRMQAREKAMQKKKESKQREFGGWH